MRPPRGGLRLALDATPLLGQRSGVGRYLEGLLAGLSRLPDPPEPLLTLFSIRGRVHPLPPGTRAAPFRAPARLLNRAWARAPFPPVEVLTGPVDVFHAGNFVLPPLWRGAGVVTVHDLAYLRFPETVDSEVRRYVDLVPASLRRAARVVTVSRAVRDELCAEYALDPARVVVAPNGVDAAWATARPPGPAARARLGLPERYLLYVGNVEPRKGLPTLMQAHRAARAAGRDVPPLALVGPAGWGDAWQGHPPDPRDVLRLGYLSDEDLRAVVAGSVAVCLPSRYEGFGLPVLEALSAGRPALASDIAAHREVGGEEATYMPVGDVDAWAHALTVVSGQADDAARAHRRQAHAAPSTWERSASVHLQAWSDAAASRPRRRPGG